MTEFLAVAAITILAVISPGPDFAMVSRNAIVMSRMAGLMTAVGIGLGVFVHVAYSMLGIGLIISQSILLFTALKLLGAAYLIWLGIKMLRAQASPAGQDQVGAGEATSAPRALWVGFLTNATNPKTTIFVVSLFVQVIDPATPLAVQLGYGVFIAVAHVAWFALVALFFSAGAVRDLILRLRHWIDRAFGALLVAFGLSLATATVQSR